MLAGLGAATARAELVDQVVATVDTEVILLSDIMAELGPEIRDLRVTAESEQAFNQAVDKRIRATVDQAIESKILYREAQLAALDIDDDIIEKQFQELKKLYPSHEEFLKELEASGESMSDLRERLRKQFLARAMAARRMDQLEKEVVISESEVAQYYHDHQEDFSRPERARCRQIFLPLEEGVSPDIVRARMEEVKREVAAGASFAELAEAFSKAAGAEDGGIIGWVVRGETPGQGDLVEALEKAVFATEEGGITDIVQTDFGFHLVKVEKREEAGLASLDEVRKEIEPRLRTQAAGERYKKWIAELRKRSRVRTFI
ncbi:MAG: peptidyl-prolyl cis-trans isomerase [Candidatus Hydrogenedentes bacterium]|nr:peptidyl-prolyl cis-trans isomerase [Candidatus Hydrogenedentota bacterium]